MPFDKSSWALEESNLVQHITSSNEQTLAAYRARPILVYEHANIERATAQGGYGRRQLYELIQNGADALVGTRRGRIHVLLTEEALYCANEGEPIDTDGVDAILSSHISRKRGAEIGRFGLGFKSVLGVTDRPEFYSWSGSFRFDAAWCRSEIKARLPDLTAINEDDRTPTLRLARPTDPAAAAAADPILEELMSWATTVVKLPRTPESVERSWLSEDLARFPAEFMLFSPHVAEVRLEDRSTLLDRIIKLDASTGVRTLVEGGNESRWRVFEISDYRPSRQALDDAGELAHRESVPIIWAVPMSGRARHARGRFWAFFPTEYETTLSGIINAPWKTNEDRQNLLPGPFNEELIGVAVDLVVENLVDLVDEADPGSFLELLPARGAEAPSWADKRLTEQFVARASRNASLPDQSGLLQDPSSMHLHPSEATERALEHWSSYPNRPGNWCHPSVFVRDRRACAERILPHPPASVSAWLEALVEDGTPDASRAAVTAAAALADEHGAVPYGVRQADIVLTADNQLVAPDPERLFLPVPLVSASGSMALVHQALASDSETVMALDLLGIRTADALGGLQALIAEGLDEETDWELFWNLAHSVPVEDAAPVLARAQSPSGYGFRRNRIRVRNKAENWCELHTVLLPGLVVPSDDPSDDRFTIDTEYHREDLEVLERIGARSAPEPGGGEQTEEWFGEYRREVVRDYYEKLDSSSRPQEDYLVFDRRTFVGPLSPMPGLSSHARASFTEAALSALGDEDLTWSLRHRTQEKYPIRPYPSPTLWRVARDGYLATSQGPVPVTLAVAPALHEWSTFLPVASIRDSLIEPLALASTLEKLTEQQWTNALDAAANRETEPRLLGRFYAQASLRRPAPDLLRCRVGELDELKPPRQITAVTSERHFDALAADGRPVVLAATRQAAADLVDRWGLQPEESAVQTSTTYMPGALAYTLETRFPDLGFYLSGQDAGRLVQPCESILEITYTDRGRTTEEKSFAVEGNTILCTQDLDDWELLARISDLLDLTLTREEIEAIVEGRRDHERKERLREIAREPDGASRLARLLDRDTISRRLPEGLLEALASDGLADDNDAVARAALAVYGVSVLKEYRDELAQAGWNPPATWTAGSRDARSFVRELGFEPVYAGREHRGRPASERVPGPALLPPLHEFQTRIREATRRLLRMEGGGRALLSLPTGAGKTRIVVQSIVEAVDIGELSGPILWVAQTEELCEQAVQTWSFVWRAIGPQRTLHISRLWGVYEAELAENAVQVVVATIDKIINRVDADEYGWLSRADCAVIDEAHGSTTPSYTSVLNWLGLGRGRERIPLLGLTATPFRGTSAEQTERLVNRYGRRRLDHGILGPDPYAHLQDIGVLAKVDHEILEGTDIILTPEELAELEQKRQLPPRVGERIGADRERNEALMKTVTSLDDDWPVLLFAASVDHAQTLAALLTLEGIPAAAISGQTERSARRYYIEQFRTGGIRVLTNYNVLTQGFDAPATRAVVVGRPTFSANLYQQMIGRGLRGPLNGGKERCLIVNVADNVSQYGQQLAFYEFEYLWSRSGGKP